jgi:muramoyltetrapeptide carboxypeptidase
MMSNPMINTFQAFKKNATVRIIAPGASSPVAADTEKNSWQDLEASCEALRAWGLQPVYSNEIFATHKSYYNFANSDENRYKDFVDAFSSDADIVWMFRGGYGSDRVIARCIQNNFKPASPKLFIGFSDVTNLHSYIGTNWGWNSLHALSLRQLGLKQVADEDVTATHDIIFGKTSALELPLIPLNARASQPGNLTANITGGNLTMIQTAIGTPWAAPLKNTILLLEDVDEAPYRIARIFQQFLASDFLSHTSAIVLGDFVPNENMALVLNEFAALAPIPVLRLNGVGHTRHNHPIPLGASTTLQFGEKCSLATKIPA